MYLLHNHMEYVTGNISDLIIDKSARRDCEWEICKTLLITRRLVKCLEINNNYEFSYI